MIIKFSYLLIFLLIPLLIFSGCSSKKTKNSEGIIQISQENNQSNMIFPAYKYRRMAPPQTTGNRGARGQLPFCVVHENEGESTINGEKIKIISEAICEYFLIKGHDGTKLTGVDQDFKGKLLKIRILSTGKQGWVLESLVTSSK